MPKNELLADRGGIFGLDAEFMAEEPLTEEIASRPAVDGLTRDLATFILSKGAAHFLQKRDFVRKLFSCLDLRLVIFCILLDPSTIHRGMGGGQGANVHHDGTTGKLAETGIGTLIGANLR